MITIGAQFWTLRDQLAADFPGTLAKVHKIGYRYVELSGHHNHSAGHIKKMLDDVGLAACCEHATIDELQTEVNRAIDDTLTLGVDLLMCPFLPEQWRENEASWLTCAKVLNAAGQTCRQQGVTLCYHNHSFEFVRVGDRYALDLLFDETDPAYLQAALDVYWIKHGGEDPVAYLRRMEGRCPIFHLKDMADDPNQSFAEVGEGILDFEAILAAAEEAGSAWGMVEQDECTGNPLDSLAMSFRNLRDMGYA